LEERAIHALWKRLSTERPDSPRAEFGDVATKDCEGKLETCIEVLECDSWLVPYMMRAKLRLDMSFSCRTLRGYQMIVRRRGERNAKTVVHAA